MERNNNEKLTYLVNERNCDNRTSIIYKYAVTHSFEWAMDNI